MGFPAESFCMSCHRTVKSDSLHIARLAAVKDRDLITKAISHKMPACIACHAAQKARNDCAVCHEER